MPKQNPYKNPIISNDTQNTTKEPKWIRPVRPVTAKKAGALVVHDMYQKQLSKVADDTKNDFSESKIKIGEKYFVVMMVEDTNLIREENLRENDQFLFEVKRDHSKGDTWGDWKFSRVLVTDAYSEDEADGYYFNGIAQVGDKNQNLFCVKRIGPDGQPVYNLAKYNTNHGKMMAGSIVSTQPITFEEGQTVCTIYERDGRISGINTNGERTLAPNTTVIDGKDNK